MTGVAIIVAMSFDGQDDALCSTLGDNIHDMTVQGVMMMTVGWSRWAGAREEEEDGFP